MRDFFGRQQLARQRTRRLVWYLALSVALIILGVYLAVRAAYLWTRLDEPGALPPFWDAGMFLLVAGATLALVLGGAWYRIRQLRGGGSRVAELFGARLLAPDSRRPQERVLLNVVEEMAIAAGLPVPSVYVLDRERGINAFAAGFTPRDAVVCVTRGALELLDRDELQGVVAHEVGHILNSDTLVNIRIMGWLNGLLLIGLVGEAMVRGLGRTRSRSGGAFIVLGFALYLLGAVGVFCGKLIKSAVSRQREALADASAVQFTRNPSGLAGALKKIGGLARGGRLAHARRLEASHMYFCNGLGESWMAMTATHPPLEERIRLLDPHFDGRFTPVEPLEAPEKAPERPPRPAPAPPAQPVQAVSGAAAAAILDSVGEPQRRHAERARQLLAALPEVVLEAVREPVGARSTIYLLLLDDQPEVRQRQLERLRAVEAFEVVERMTGLERLPAASGGIAPPMRLPLADLALPALRGLSPDEYRVFRGCVKGLVEADGRLSPFELALGCLLLNQLGERFGERRPKVTQIYGVRGVSHECALVLSVLARQGHGEPQQVKEAFGKGARILQEPKVGLGLLPEQECTLAEMERALQVLAVTSSLIKRKLLAACLECLLADRVVGTLEVELFRAVAAALDCPVPPWLGPGDEEA